MIFLCKTIFNFKDIISIYKADDKLQGNIKKITELINRINMAKDFSDVKVILQMVAKNGGIFKKLLDVYYVN